MATTINGSTGASQVQDDIVTEDKLNLISTASVPSLEAKGSGSQDGYIQLNCYANTHGIKLKSPPHSANANYTLTFPNNDGDASQFLQTNGSGVMSWAAPSGGGVTLLSTIATTSGTTVASSTLDLSTYLTLQVFIYNVGNTTSGGVLRWAETSGTSLQISGTTGGAGKSSNGVITHNLATGVSHIGRSYDVADGTTTLNYNGSSGIGINTEIDTATTSISFNFSGGETFDGGTIKIYGLK